MLTFLHPAGKAPRDGVTGLRADGSTLGLATARLIEISSAQGGFVSLTLTRFFRSFEDEPIDAALTMLGPPGAPLPRGARKPASRRALRDHAGLLRSAASRRASRGAAGVAARTGGPRRR